MKPIEFKEQNCVYAKDQPEYLLLPAHRKEDGTVISCWELTDEEIKQLVETKRIYIGLFTFNQPLQPILLMVENPLEDKYCYGVNIPEEDLAKYTEKAKKEN